MALNFTKYNPAITDGTTYVVISNTKFTPDWTNTPTIINIPTTKLERGTANAVPEQKTLLINLLKITKQFTINGVLVHGRHEYSNGNYETHTYARDKWLALKTLLEGGSTLSVIYDGTTYNGVVTKQSLPELVNDNPCVVGDSGTASAATSSTLSDSTKTWVVNELAGKSIVITGGLGVGQIRDIISNTSNQVTVNTWETTPNTTSTYKLVNQIVDGVAAYDVTLTFVVGIDKLVSS